MIGHSPPRETHTRNRDQSVTSGRLPTMFVNANIETAVTVRKFPGRVVRTSEATMLVSPPDGWLRPPQAGTAPRPISLLGRVTPPGLTGSNAGT